MDCSSTQRWKNMFILIVSCEWRPPGSYIPASKKKVARESGLGRMKWWWGEGRLVGGGGILDWRKGGGDSGCCTWNKELVETVEMHARIPSDQNLITFSILRIQLEYVQCEKSTCILKNWKWITIIGKPRPGKIEPVPEKSSINQTTCSKKYGSLL
jgi:hypothetical protein